MASYSTLHLASQNCLADISNECARFRIIWAICELKGSYGMTMRQVCVVEIVQPSGSEIYTGCVIGCLLIIFAFGSCSQVKYTMICLGLKFLI